MRTSAPQPLVRAPNSLAVLPARVVGVPGQTDVNAIRHSVRLGPGGYGFRGPSPMPISGGWGAWLRRRIR